MRRLLLMGTFVFAACLTCRADEVTFNFQGIISDGNATPGPGGSAAGTVTIDTVSGLVTGLDVSASTTSSYLGGITSATFTSVFSQGAHAGYYEMLGEQGDYKLTLDLPVTTLIGYGGGDLCSYADEACGAHLSTYQPPQGGTAFLSASLTEQVAATPEPSSLALLGSGVLGMVGVMRRRMRA